MPVLILKQMNKEVSSSCEGQFIKRCVKRGVFTMVTVVKLSTYCMTEFTGDMSVKTNIRNMTGPTSLITVGPCAILLLEKGNLQPP